MSLYIVVLYLSTRAIASGEWPLYAKYYAQMKLNTLLTSKEIMT